MKYATFIAAVFVMAGSMAWAMDHDKMEGKLSHNDAKFVHEAASGGMMEVQLGKMATEKASAESVKEFGQRIVDDHGKANAELKALATDKDVKLSPDLMKKHQEMVDDLSKLDGDAFDKAYMKMMVKDHEEDVDAFEKAADKCEDADVKAFAAKTVPTLKAHLALAKQVRENLN